MDYWQNYVGLYLTEGDLEVAKLLRNFVEWEIMPVRHLVDDDKDHSLVITKILQGLTGVVSGMLCKKEQAQKQEGPPSLW